LKSRIHQPQLKNLHGLTHARLNEAIQNAMHNDSSITMLTQSENAAMEFSNPYQRLRELIDPDKLDRKALLSGFAVLADILGGTVDDIIHNPNLLDAVNTFIQFMIQGNNYISLKGRGNTCLHDALDYGAFSYVLMVLLVVNGANAILENDSRLTPIATWAIRYYPEADLKMLSIEKKNPLEKLRLAIAYLMKENENTLPLLAMMELYFLFQTHTEFLNGNYNHPDQPDFLLHLAASSQSADVVKFLLSKGANPDLLNGIQFKPIHHAVLRAMKFSCFDPQLEECITIITSLLLSSLHRARLSGVNVTAELVVNELLTLDLTTIGYREKVCRSLFSLNDQQAFIFTEEELFASLKHKLKELNHEEIEFSCTSIVGGGSFCQVYKGTQHLLGKSFPVAIKMGTKCLGQNTLKEEDTIHSQLNHPNIIRYICAIERHDYAGIVMSYASGGTLEQFIYNHSKFQLAQVFYSFTKQINAGLGYLHSTGYVHLDFKPANILLESNRLLIADFGSTAKQGETRWYKVTSCHYSSPERFDALNPYCFANDIFSFAIVIGEMDTQQYPWPLNIKDEQVENFICKGLRPTFNKTNMTPHAAKLVKWCWKQEPEKRPTSEQIDAHLEKHFKV